MGKKDTYDDLPLRVDLRAKKKGEPAVSLRRGGAKPKRLSNLKPSRIGPIRGVSAPATRTPERLGSRRVVVKARVIKMTAYGVGLGLVLVGWVAGLVVSYVFSIIRGVGRLG